MTSEQNPPSTSSLSLEGKKTSPMGLVAQIAGFVVGIGLLAWFVRDVLQPANRPNLDRLLNASGVDVGMLLGLSAVSIFLSGATFRQALVPVRRLPMMDVQATNVIASFLSLLPFKLSILFRVLIHNRRDGVPVMTIGAWFLVIAAVIMAALGPVMVTNAVYHKIDSVWFVAALGGVALAYGLLVASAKFASSASGWGRVERLWSALPMPGFVRRSSVLERGHEGVRMAADAGSMAILAGIRLTEIAVQTGRVAVGAHIVGQEIALDTAVLAGTVYFLIGAASPAGQVGVREQGTSKLVGVVAPTLEMGPLQTIILSITLAEVLVLMVCASAGAMYLKPWKLAKRTAMSTAKS